MQNIINKRMKYFALFLSGVLLVSITTFGADNLGFGSANVSPRSINSGDRRVASELSNITGVDVETILNLRNKDISWNEVIESLKAKGLASGDNNIDSMLSQPGIENKFINRLKQEGFAEIEIEQAFLIADRIVFQLQQISTDADDIEYKDLLSEFNRETCVYLMLKLNKEFGGMEKVLDEYLYSLQTNTDFTLYLTDKQEYLAQKQEKEKYIIGDNFITAAMIGEKMLESISKQNIYNMAHHENNSEFETIPGRNPETVLPYIPDPAIENPRVVNPLDSIINDLEIIDPLKNR